MGTRMIVLLIVAAVAGSACLAIGAEWTIESVDGGGAGYYSSVKVDRAGNLHLAYVSEAQTHPLKYSFWDQKLKRWFTMQVAANASFSALALDSKDQPHISFVDFGTGFGCKVRHARWNGTWTVNPIDVRPGAIMAYYTSIALNQNDDPILTFYDYADAGSNTTLCLRSLFWTGTYWQAATVDRTQGSGKFNSVAIDSSGRPQVAYANVDAMHSGFRYAIWDGKAWKVEIIEGADRPIPVYSLSMVLDNKDNPHVVYTDLAHRWIKYATRLNGKWLIQPIDSYKAAAEGQGYWDRNGILLDSQGNPYISYFDKGTGVLKVAHRQGTRWLVEIVDSGMSGMTSSMAITNGEIWVAYAALLEQSLKVAHRPLEGPVQTTLSEQRESVSVSKK